MKSSEDLCPSLLLRVMLWHKIFLFVELREEKGKISHPFKGMVVFIELSDAATRCPCFLMTAQSGASARMQRPGPDFGAHATEKS